MSDINLNEVLLKKISGLINSIESMSDKDKSSTPSEDYGKNINSILEKAREGNPELKSFIPTNVSFFQSRSNRTFTQTSWIEMHAKLKQLQELLEK